MRQVWQPKFASDTAITRQWDFSSLLGAGESVASVSIAVSVYSGTDPSPSSILNGAAVVASPLVAQSVTSGVAGVIYEAKCTATTTGVSPSQTLGISCYLAIIPDLP